jgi:hypothetical protein
MSGHCGLNSWQQNSELIQATANDPEGPYTYNSTILPHFSHGAKVRTLNDGSYFMMHLGCGYPFKPFKTGCVNGTSVKKASVADEIVDPPLCNQFNVSVKTAKDPKGPWSESQQVFLSSGTTPASSSW